MDAEKTNLYPLLTASLIFLTLLLLMFVVSVIRNYRRRLAEYQLHVAHEIELIDGERKRIAADLHDEVGTGLSAIGLMLQQVFEKTGENKLLRANEHLRTQQQKLKEISFDLIPHTLESRGLWIALWALAEELYEASGTVIVFTRQDTDIILDAKRAIHVYRIMRELLTNAIKHANASRIDVYPSMSNSELVIEITDNGKGFNPHPEGRNDSGRGLQNIQARVEVLKALLDVQSVKGGGTRFTLRIPSV